MAKKKKQKSNRGYATTSIPKKVQTAEEQNSDKNEEITNSLQIIETLNSSENTKSEIDCKTIENEILKKAQHLQKIAKERESLDLKIKDKNGISAFLNMENEKLIYDFKCDLPFERSTNYKEYEISYLRLLNCGFSVDQIHEILEKSRIPLFNDLVVWICLNFPKEELPLTWSDNAIFQEKKYESVHITKVEPRPNFEISTENDENFIFNHKSELESEELSFNKRWILENVASSESEAEEEKVNEISVSAEDLQTRMFELMNQAAEAKLAKDRILQKELGSQIVKIKNLMLKNGAKLETKPQPTESGPPVVDIEDDVESDVDIGDFMESIETNVSEPRSNTIKEIRILKLEKPKGWSGTSAVELWDNLLGKQYDNYKIQYTLQKEPFGNRYIATVIGLGDTKVNIETNDYFANQHQAKEYIACRGIYSTTTNRNYWNQLPATYQDLFVEWKNAADYELQKNVLDESKTRENFLTKLCEEPIISDKDTQNDFYIPPKQIKSQNIPIIDVNQLKKRMESESYQILQKTREALPAFQSINEIESAVSNSNVVIVSGETGSGKSTQIPQFLMSMSIKAGLPFKLVCTQPRRISAISLAARVSEETGDFPPLSDDNWVGYKVRADSCVSKQTCIIYCTTGIILREMELNPQLVGYSHILVDEVHERTLDTDFLLLLLKKLLLVRKDLKIILMSATANAKHFSDYFAESCPNEIPWIQIPGKTHPVTTYYLEEIIQLTGYRLALDSEYAVKDIHNSEYTKAKVSTLGKKKTSVNLINNVTERLRSKDPFQFTIDYMDARKINYELIVSLIYYICKRNEAGSIGGVLVFLPGLYEIQLLENILHDEFTLNKELNHKLEILPLHGRLNKEEQSLIFRKPQTGYCKIVLATNVAETGVTIPDIVYVIDSTKAKEVRFSILISYDHKKGLNRLSEISISKANAKQRRGRAGRVRPGHCFHLITKKRFENLADYRPPESVRLPVDEICLKLKTITGHKGSIMSYLECMIDPPPIRIINSSLQTLKSVGAMNSNEMITPIGIFLSKLPMDVRLGKTLLYGILFSCLDPIITIISILIIGKTPYMSETEKKLLELKSVGWVNAYNSWQKLHSTKASRQKIEDFARIANLSILNLESIYRTRMEILQVLQNMDIIPNNFKGLSRGIPDFTTFNENVNNAKIIATAFSLGVYPNVLLKSPAKYSKEGQLFIPSSVQTIVRLKKSSSCYSFVTMSEESAICSYYTMQLMKSKVGSPEAIVWDLSRCSIFAYAVMVGTTFSINPTAHILEIDDFLTIKCSPMTISLLWKLRIALKRALAQICDGKFDRCEGVSVLEKLL